MILTDKAIFSCDEDGVTRVLLAEPRECRCGHMAAFAVNRDGETRCVPCDDAYAREKSRRVLIAAGDVIDLDLEETLRISKRSAS